MKDFLIEASHAYDNAEIIHTYSRHGDDWATCVLEIYEAEVCNGYLGVKPYFLVVLSGSMDGNIGTMTIEADIAMDISPDSKRLGLIKGLLIEAGLDPISLTDLPLASKEMLGKTVRVSLENLSSFEMVQRTHLFF